MRGPQLDQMQPHQPSYLALRQSAQAGCQLCHVFWLALEQHRGLHGEKGVGRAALAHVSEQYPGRQISLVAWGASGGPLNLDHINIITTGEIPSISDNDESDGDYWPEDPTMHPEHQDALNGVVDLYAYPDDPAAWHGGISGRPLPQTAGDSEEDFELVSKWISECLNRHHNCCKASIESKLPTRVIDVGPSDGSGEPFLMESQGRIGRYNTLSHCWGGEVPLTTTTATLGARKEEIPFTALPKTFQDAVIITRKLGIRYLWIDSLCILQDSRDDWRSESALMGQVYALGYLNIAARSAVNARSGCFIARQPEPPACPLVYESSDSSVTGSMYIRDPSYQAERLKDSPLDKRGWVLQERVLSPRIVHYGRTQIFWECLEASFRQDGKHYDAATDEVRVLTDIKQHYDFDATDLHSSIRDNRMFDESTMRQQHQIAKFQRWYGVVSEYTRRDLTFSSDKLTAIAGLAKTFQSKYDTTYIAGLWQENLIEGLLWCLAKPSQELASENLPSWSWARWEGVVRFWNQQRSSPIPTLDGACSLVSVEASAVVPFDSFGEVNAKIHLKGHVLHATYEPLTPLNFELDHTVFTQDGRPIGRITFDSCHLKPRSFSCLLVHGGKVAAVALALEPDRDSAEIFRRIGYVSISEWKGDGRKPFLEEIPRSICLV